MLGEKSYYTHTRTHTLLKATFNLVQLVIDTLSNLSTNSTTCLEVELALLQSVGQLKNPTTYILRVHRSTRNPATGVHTWRVPRHGHS